MDLLQVFENFKLDTLDENWSDEVWSSEFLSFPEPPVEYSILLGSEDIQTFLRETCRIIKIWMAENKKIDEIEENERAEVSWQTLAALNVNIRGLLAVLGYLIKVGLAAGSDEDSRQACLASASLYFTLLSIPGSTTYQVFHPNLFERAVDTLKLSEHLIVIRKTRVTDLESLYLDDQPEDMLQSEKTTLVISLNSILYDMITMLKSFYMKYQLRSLEILIINLVDVTKIESDVNIFQSHYKRNEATKASLSYNAYVALMDLCEPRHGVVEDTIRLIIKYLMPHLCSNHLDLPPKAANVVSETIINFLKNLLTAKELSAELSIEILVQHLYVKSPERSEPRQKQAVVISKLINICEGNLFYNQIKNLVEFAFHNRIPYRIFAQEVIAKLLLDSPENMFCGKEKAEMLLIATVLSRSTDYSSMVRGKVMSTIESVINNTKWNVDEFLDLTDDDKRIPTVDDLTKTLETEDYNPLPGRNTLNNVLLDRIKDERALVRRSAMHGLQNLVTHFPELLDKVVPIIGQHTRDPTLTVRKDAINVLANLLQSHPLNSKLLNEYVRAVLPRIYDVETKVQEKVLESLQNLMLDNISLFTLEVSNEIHHLPWKLIKIITDEKMRKNLSKICDSWVKNNIITDTVVRKIQTHIGTDHDIEAWTLILALSENKHLPSMEKYFQNFQNIIEGDDFVTVLKLEVLRHSWKNMKKDYLKNLSEHIYECLCKFSVCLECISICIDILDGITKQGSKGGEDIMQSKVVNLMRLSENEIEQLAEEDSEIEEEKINTYLKAMNTLGHASFLCSDNVSESTLSIIQSLLLDCDSIEASAHSKEKFKAAGIVILGQQAMRDREFAEQVMPILGKLMCQSSTSNSLAQAAIKINSVKALADLCVRFTALVEPYLPDMCISMKDPNAAVREAIVVIFVQLLLEDYIKVKGSFFYHILTMLADNDETIRDLTVFLIKERLIIKNKTLIPQSFVSSIFHYNNCPTKHKFNERKIRKKEQDALTLPGQKNQTKRRIVYDFMMEHLDPPSKLKIFSKLNSEILEGVFEKLINIKKTEGACLLKDVLYILSNDRMQVSFSNKTQDEDFNDETSIALENATNKAINVIVEGMKRFKLKVMLPTLIKLKKFLLSNKSSLITDVSKFFIKVISDFTKDQVAELYDEYPELKKDLERDIR